jgi:hypothetical protein
MALPLAWAGWLARHRAEGALTPAQEGAPGFEIDLGLDLRAGDVRPWSELATLLMRNTATRACTRGSGARETWALREPDVGWQVAAVRAAADLGHRYAPASGDWNPHHW